MTHHRPAAAVSSHSDRRFRNPTNEVGGSVGMLADDVDYVIGVDTHLRSTRPCCRCFAVRRCGRETVAPCQHTRLRVGVSVCVRGYAMALASGRSKAPAATAPVLLAFSSAAASRCSRSAAYHGRERRLRGKDDTLDAARTARTALASDTLAFPRSGERREALRLLLIARRSAVDVRREALTQLRGVIVTAPERLREQLRALPSASCSTAVAASVAQAR